jgi:FAD/FMN-containing dehydrogenase
MRIDPITQVVAVEASQKVDQLAERLHHKGWTLGYIPQPSTASTLETCLNENHDNLLWRRYGTLEELCLTLTIKGRKGRHYKFIRVPRAATGPDLKRLFFGNQGQLGKVEEVSLRLHKLPEKKIWALLYWPQLVKGQKMTDFENKASRLKGSLAFLKLLEGKKVPKFLARPQNSLHVLYFEGTKDLVEAHYHYLVKVGQFLGAKCVSWKEIGEMEPQLEKLMRKG